LDHCGCLPRQALRLRLPFCPICHCDLTHATKSSPAQKHLGIPPPR
jgi:hypothetical protein